MQNGTIVKSLLFPKELLKRLGKCFWLMFVFGALPFWCAAQQSESVDELQKSVVKNEEIGKKVRGVVKDENGDALPGVSVIVKGTHFGVVTDVNGNFELRVDGSNPKLALLFSFVGMKSKEVVVGGKDYFAITLEADVQALDEVIVDGGYQKLPRKDMVGAYTTVKAEDLNLSAYTSIDQMLQGRVAGLVAVNQSSRVGRAPKLTIRGVSTILGNTDPLWVVDGIIQPDPMPFDANSAMASDLSQMVASQIAWLNPADIETVTVLKDASATAVYGSKASNGVIVVTTKRGKADRMSLRYSVNMGVRFQPNYRQFDLMNSQERIRFSKEAYDVGVRYMKEPYPQLCTYEGLMRMLNMNMIDEETFKREVAFLETVNTDWFDLLTRNSFNHTHNLTISGGSQKTTYSASLSYTNNKGVEVGNDYDRLNVRLGVNAKLMEKLRLDFSVNGSLANTYGYGPGVNPMSYATKTARSLPAFDRNGERLFHTDLFNYYWNANPVDLSYNILNEMDNSSSRMKNNRLDASINLSYQVLPWLDYQLVTGVSYSANNSRSYAGERSRYIAQNYRGYDYGSEEVNSERFNAAMLPFGGELFTNDAASTTYTMQHKLVFSKTVNKIHRINAMAAAEIRSTTNSSTANTVWGYVPERGEKIMTPTPLSQLKPIGKSSPVDWGIFQQLYNGKWSTQERTDNFFAFFATVAYSLKDRYVLNANVRNDISNRFGQDVNKRFDPTYSFGLQWRMSEEAFIKDYVSWIDQLSLRGTFGIQGNVVNSISPDLIVSQLGILPGYNEYYLGIASLPNPLLKWERTKTFNVGLDLQLFSGISMSLEYYGRRSNAIVNQDVAQEYGVTRMRLNGGLIRNNGVEYTLNITPFKRDNLVWNINVNVSKNWNRAESEDTNYGATATNSSHFIAGSSDRLLKKGYPLGAFWSYDFAGLNPENGYPMFNNIAYDQEDPTIDPTTFLTYSGQKDPYFTGGFNTNIKYRSVSLSANFSALVGGKKRLPNPYASFSEGNLPDARTNLSKVLNDRWKKPGDEAHTHIPGLWTDHTGNVDFRPGLPDGNIPSLYDMWASSDVQVVNASFLRCTQISLSWFMSQRLCKKFGATSFSASASVSNVFVIASKRFNGFDPELGNSVMPRMFSFGFNVGF